MNIMIVKSIFFFVGLVSQNFYYDDEVDNIVMIKVEVNVGWLGCSKFFVKQKMKICKQYCFNKKVLF